MEIRNCAKCKKAFYQIKDPICPDCAKEEEVIFESVREYIKENPNVSLATVSDELNVSVKKIKGYIRDGKIDISELPQIKIYCDSCGVSILTGRYCEKCLAVMHDKVNGSIKQESGKSIKLTDNADTKGNKMHISSRLERKKL